MPVPSKTSYAPSVDAAFSNAELEGDAIGAFTAALADSLDQALRLFAAMAVVEPGIPGSVDPATTAGATTGPGKLTTPPVGGPDIATLKPIVRSTLTAKGIRGQRSEALATAVAGAIALGISEFTKQVQIAPGVPVAGAVTVAPGNLV